MSAATLLSKRIKQAVKRADRDSKLENRTARKRAREFLAMQIGVLILNAIEAGGQLHIRDYAGVTPNWALRRYLDEIT